MAHTKSQFDRLLIIHNKLATGNRYTFQELRSACTPPGPDGKPPSEKTLYNDLRELREVHGAPIPEKDRSGRPYYYLPGTSFSLHSALNPDDAALANELTAMLKHATLMPVFGGMEDVFLKFEQRAGVVGKAEKPVLQWEQNMDYVGLKWLKPLYDAIRAGCCVLIDYQDFSASQSTRYEVSPYLLREYNNRWFLLGRAAGWQEGRPFPLDRMLNVTALPNLRCHPDQTDWSTEFADVVGVTRIAKNSVETLVLRVHLPRARYVDTKPLHQSQDELARTATYVDFQYRLRWNNELVSQILSLGPDAELLEPAHRREEIAEKARKLLARYQV